MYWKSSHSGIRLLSNQGLGWVLVDGVGAGIPSGSSFCWVKIIDISLLTVGVWELGGVFDELLFCVSIFNAGVVLVDPEFSFCFE